VVGLYLLIIHVTSLIKLSYLLSM